MCKSGRERREKRHTSALSKGGSRTHPIDVCEVLNPSQISDSLEVSALEVAANLGNTTETIERTERGVAVKVNVARVTPNQPFKRTNLLQVHVAHNVDVVVNPDQVLQPLERAQRGVADDVHVAVNRSDVLEPLARLELIVVLQNQVVPHTTHCAPFPKRQQRAVGDDAALPADKAVLEEALEIAASAVNERLGRPVVQ